MERTAENSWVAHQVSDWYSSILFWGRPVFPENKTKHNKTKINSEFTFFAAITRDVTQICRSERSLKKQNKQEKQLQKAQGLFSAVAPQLNWAKSSAGPLEADPAKLTWETPFSSSNSPLPPSPNILLKAAVRSQAWRPLALRKWLLWFILPANLLTRAKTLYPSPAHRSPLVPTKAAACCQSSQGCRVWNAN